MKGRSLRAIRHPVNQPRLIIADIHRPIRSEHNSCGASTAPSSLVLPAGNEVFSAAHRLSFVIELHADHFVTGRNTAIPRSVERDKNVIAIFGRERCSFIERETQWG